MIKITIFGITVDGHRDHTGDHSPQETAEALRELGMKFLQYQVDSKIPADGSSIETQITWIKIFCSLTDPGMTVSIIIMPAYAWVEQGGDWYWAWREQVVERWMQELKALQLQYPSIKFYVGIYWGEFFGAFLPVHGLPLPDWHNIDVTVHHSNFVDFGNLAGAYQLSILHWHPNKTIMAVDPAYYTGKWMLTSSFPDLYAGGWIAEVSCAEWTEDTVKFHLRSDMRGWYRDNKKAISTGMWSNLTTLCPETSPEPCKCWSYSNTTWTLELKDEEAPALEFFVFMATIGLLTQNEGFRLAIKEYMGGVTHHNLTVQATPLENVKFDVA